METKRVARRNHSAEFREQVLAACGESGASVAAIAMRNGLNANVIYRWLREKAHKTQTALVTPTQASQVTSFLPVQLLARGYHSAVHQFDNQQRCPVHGCLLETHCHSCGATSIYRIDAKVIGSPFRCANCGSHYSRSPPSVSRRATLPQQGRTAITRTFFG